MRFPNNAYYSNYPVGQFPAYNGNQPVITNNYYYNQVQGAAANNRGSWQFNPMHRRNIAVPTTAITTTDRSRWRGLSIRRIVRK